MTQSDSCNAGTGAIPGQLVFYRPHANIWFKTPVRGFIKREFLPHKYEALLDLALATNDRVRFASSLHREPGAAGLIRFFLDPLELAVWCHLNKIPKTRFKYLWRKKSLSADDVIIFLHYGTFTAESREAAETASSLATRLAELPARKVVHMTHYAYQPAAGSKNLRTLHPTLLVAENNLQKNSSFYRKYFDTIGDSFSQLPYVASRRFVRTDKPSQRINKLLATGSITYQMNAAEFTGFFGTRELQPVRRELFNAAANFKSEMECFISDLNASRSNDKRGGRRIWRRIAALVRGGHPQQAYYKADIVALYNSYAMFVVPEEVCDLPAIGFVEGMACGCAYFGLDDPMYRDLGMMPGVHYVTYDGSVDDLMARVRFYQQPENTDELTNIADRGRQLVDQKLRADIVYRSFFIRLGGLFTAEATNV